MSLQYFKLITNWHEFFFPIIFIFFSPSFYISWLCILCLPFLLPQIWRCSVWLWRLGTWICKSEWGLYMYIVAPTVVQPETSTKVVPQPKKHPVLKEKCLPPPIMLPRYTWVDGEVGTYYPRYTHELKLLILLSWLPISTITKLEYCPITLRIVRSDATLPLEFVFMN